MSLVHLDNQWIFYNINKNFWLKFTYCENKSWKKLFPSFKLRTYINQRFTMAIKRFIKPGFHMVVNMS